MGNLVERIGGRKAGISVEPLSGVTNEFDVRLGNGWVGEVIKLGGSEALRWTSREFSFFTHDRAVSDLAQMLTGNANLLKDPGNYKVKVSVFIEPKKGDYSSEKQFKFPYVDNSFYRDIRRESRRVNDGRKISIEHSINRPNDNLVFTLKTVMHPPHDVSELTLQVADEYANKWPALYDWVVAHHVNRERFGLLFPEQGRDST